MALNLLGYPPAGLPNHVLGEILAGASGDVEAVIAAWLSRAQREDVLKPNFTHIGAHYTFASRTSYRHYWTVKLAEAGP